MTRIRSPWQKFKQELAIWKVAAIPGLMVIGLIVFLRLFGWLQPMEWWAFDLSLRLRPPELTDERILIVGIDEADIRAIGTYPIPDTHLAALVEKLQASQPRAIGIDIVRDLPVPPGYDQFTRVLQSNNVFGIDKAFGRIQINPPPALPAERVGFADLIYDSDGAVRRALIEARGRFSWPMLLTERYLNLEQPPLEMGTAISDSETMQFGSTEFTRFRSRAGGYVNADDRGNQILINYRTGQQPFRIVTLTEVMQNKVPADWIRDRLVMIGMRAVSVGDMQQVNAVDRVGPVYGVEVHAHIASQMLNAVLQGRPWLQTWPDPLEYLWIIGWGILGISLGRVLVAPWKIVLGLIFACCILVGLSFMAILQALWLPVVPAFLLLVLNGAGLTASLFYRHQQLLQARLTERQELIDTTYTRIHNVPVQTVTSLLRRSRSGNLAPQQLTADLERLVQELRAIETDLLRPQPTLSQDSLLLFDGRKLDLHRPIHELLYETYRSTMSRTQDYPRFATVGKIYDFKAIDNRRLTIKQKKGICEFLEEAICNTGKYGEGMTLLKVGCKTEKGQNWIWVIDNGAGIQATSPTGGYGTRQAERLAMQLGGNFQRRDNSPKGTICELSYPVSNSGWQRLRRLLQA